MKNKLLWVTHTEDADGLTIHASILLGGLTYKQGHEIDKELSEIIKRYEETQ